MLGRCQKFLWLWMPMWFFQWHHVCDANVRITLVGPHFPTNETTYMPTWSIGCTYLIACSFTPALLPNPSAKHCLCLDCMLGSVGKLYCPVITAAMVKWRQLTGALTSTVHSRQRTAMEKHKFERNRPCSNPINHGWWCSNAFKRVQIRG